MTVPAHLFKTRPGALLLAAALGWAALATAAESTPAMHDAGAAMAMPGMEQHAHHMQAMNATGYQRATARYTLPALQLTDSSGEPVDVARLLATDQPLVVNFIFTSCTTICPIMSATFARAQQLLGVDAKNIQWVSISIDPEYDTPERLRAYAQRYAAGDNWHFLTGDISSSIALQKAFAVYRGDKMNHAPTTLLRAGRDQPWLRLDGLTSGAELVHEYRQLAASHH